MTQPDHRPAGVARWPRALRNADEREFLPAALEIMETPASPLGRVAALSIVSFFCVAFAWAWFGYVDIIATARGQLVPTGKTKIVQSLEPGIVRQIAVRDGDHVSIGQVLVRLEDASALAERDRIDHDLMRSRLDVARLRALLRATEEPDDVAVAVEAPQGAPRALLETARALAASQAAEQAAKLAGLDEQLKEKKAESEEADTVIEKLQATMPLLDEKQQMRTQLLETQYGNRFAFLDAKQALIEAHHDLDAEREKLSEVEAARVALERQRDQTRAEYAHKILSDLSEAEQKVGEATEDLIKAQQKLSQTTLSAPINGVAQQLAVHTIGGVVTSAQALLVIVPDDEQLVVEAMVDNSDIGFVQPGQRAEVKVETFNFTRYGFVSGRVIDVSADAVTPDKSTSGDSQEEERNDRNAHSASPSAAYVARIALDMNKMMIEGRDEPLKPGMAVSAEIRTGSRRILDYLLSPLRKYEQDAMHER